jgi:hypothetical protein
MRSRGDSKMYHTQTFDDLNVLRRSRREQSGGKWLEKTMVFD